MMATDRTKWTLDVKEGRQRWFYHPEGLPRPQSTFEKHALGMSTAAEAKPLPKAENAADAYANGVEFFQLLQTEDGHWAGDYGGPLFLLPGLVISCHVTGIALRPEQKAEIIYYLKGQQKPEGGWGVHIDHYSTVFGTALNYVTLRLLGVPRDDPAAVRARAFLHQHGGAVGIPSWGKFWLAVLNVYDWDGLNPLLPELWLLPTFVPAHPSKLWCHCRQVYLPMGYCYGVRLCAQETDLIRELREELYVQPYDSIDWAKQRNNVAHVDLYNKHTMFLDLTMATLGIYERFHIPLLRKWALDLVYDHVRAEDDNTKYIGIGPVSKVINTLVRWHRDGPNSAAMRGHADRIPDYLWLAADGMKMNGTNGSQMWDTGFAVLAILEGGADAGRFAQCLQRAYDFLDVTQVKENVPQYNEFFRQMSKGAFPFSTRDCGWIVADCTALGLKAVMQMHARNFTKRTIPDERLFDNVNVLLDMQNSDGGWATYEKKRGGPWLEYLNPSEVFGDIMIDYTYVECTSSALQGLLQFRERFPNHRPTEIKRAIDRAIDFVRRVQRPDGSWEGCWGVCFTYGAWFALEGLGLTGDRFDRGTPSESVIKGCEFLLSKQMPDGGWAESHESCVKREYVPMDTSQVVNTAWAVLALMAVRYDRAPIERGIRLLMSRQLPNGDWAEEGTKGIFNKNCTISYTNYRNIFPIWALGRFARLYGDLAGVPSP